MTAKNKSLTAFASRSDLKEYGDNGLLLFVSDLVLGIEDIKTFASTSLTDGSNDKGCDLVAVSEEHRQLIIAQGYWSAKERVSASSGKATSMNQAVSWLFAGNLDEVPSNLRGAAEEARLAISEGRVDEVQLWFVHNCPESVNVKTELRQAAKTADGIITRHFADVRVDVTSKEYGLESVEQLYERGQVPILVSDVIEFEIPGGYHFSGDEWSAFSTLISAKHLHQLWNTYKSDLLSPNIRSYLGSTRSTRNINNGIKGTAQSDPSNFAVFNNGITVLVHDFKVSDTRKGKQRLSVTGLGIVNGGQTTGSIGSIDVQKFENLGSASVMARFIKCDDEAVLERIVRFNNTQNKVEATDFRSKDGIQLRLRDEFKSIPDADYRGGMRGGDTDAIARSRTLLADKTVAQALSAFHGDANRAYNETRTIWERDDVYSAVFTESLTARHVVFVFGLLRAVESVKYGLINTPEEERTAMQKKQADFFSQRGSIFLLVQAMGDSVEELVGRVVVDRHSLTFKENLSPAEAEAAWIPVVERALGACSQLAEATNQNLKSTEKTSKAISTFMAMLGAIISAAPEATTQFAKLVETS